MAALPHTLHFAEAGQGPPIVLVHGWATSGRVLSGLADALRRGARVKHDRFGEGEVRSVTHAGEPAVVAFFPGWGEKKVLARFLKFR